MTTDTDRVWKLENNIMIVKSSVLGTVGTLEKDSNADTIDFSAVCLRSIFHRDQVNERQNPHVFLMDLNGIRSSHQNSKYHCFVPSPK